MRDGRLKRLLLRLLANRRMRKLLGFLEACRYADRRVWDHEWGNRLIATAIESGRPHAVGKIGSVELLALRKYLECWDRSDAVNQTATNRRILYTNAGVFPNDYATCQRFSRLMLEEVLPQTTFIGVWFNLGESRIVKRYAPQAGRIPASAIQALFLSRDPWTSLLEGRKVLVVHPFERSVRHQFARRQKIWPSHQGILPGFQLDVLKVPQCPALVPPIHRDWFEALDVLREGMARRDFDVALIGAGAYSLPLAVHAKRLGKQGVHLGGGLQIMFGIKGRRWDKTPESRFYNDAWVRPLPEDTPPGVALVEDGCYW